MIIYDHAKVHDSYGKSKVKTLYYKHTGETSGQFLYIRENNKILAVYPENTIKKDAKYYLVSKYGF